MARDNCTNPILTGGLSQCPILHWRHQGRGTIVNSFLSPSRGGCNCYRRAGEAAGWPMPTTVTTAAESFTWVSATAQPWAQPAAEPTEISVWGWGEVSITYRNKPFL